MQDPAAIELMYHAADPKSDASFAYSTRSAAIYFGLSVVKEKTPAILRELAEIAVRSDDPNDLDRIAWGTRSQQAEMLEMIKPYADDEQTSGKAETVRRILSGELKAFDWATEQAVLNARTDFGAQLPQMKADLTSGTSVERAAALKIIGQRQVALIMDETYIPAFEAAAADTDADVRKSVAIIAGGRWIWKADQQSSAAIELMMKLSQDPEREVRYNAV